MLTASQITSLKALFPPGQVYCDFVSRLPYTLDAGQDRGEPDGVVILSSAQDAQRLMQWAMANQVCLVARGAGTGLTGGAVAAQAGVIASFAQMKAILQVDQESRQAIVEVGVINQVLQQRLAPLGLIYPPDPASYSVATIGGNIAENAGGPHCLKYGVTGNYVLGLDAVLADGRSVRLGSAAYDPPEYDFAGLLTGSEGTLALITQAILGLRRSAAAVKTLTASFDAVAVAGQAVSAIIAAGLTPATIELMDRNMINIVEDYLGLGLLRQAAALLIFDVEGYPESLDAQLDGVAEILERFSPLEIKIARTAEERERLWLGRRSAAGAVARISPSEYVLDVSVPRSRLAEALREIDAIAVRHRLPTAYLAHAGDGNLHPGLLCDLSREDDRRRVHQAVEEILHYCAGIGGSIGGEHGVGIEKRTAMSSMYSPAELSAMLDVKQVFDPQGLLNPGKIFPPTLEPAAPAPPSIGALPGDLFEPANPSETADGLRRLQEIQQSTRIAGGGQQWRGAADSGLVLSTQNLRRVLNLSADDFYVTALAGSLFAELQAELVERGFWIAAANPWRESTLGGMLATNLNHPLRMLYGGLRDQVLAVQVALADGRLLRFGRPLAKDVAGYQMNKLFCGAYGTLGVLTEVTLRILPLPIARRTLVWTGLEPARGLQHGLSVTHLATLASGVILIAGLPQDPSAPGCSLCITLEGYPVDVMAELREFQKALGDPAYILDEADQATSTYIWAERLAVWPFSLRAGVAPSALPGLLNRLAPGRLGGEWMIDIGSGILSVGGASVDIGRAAALLAELRQAAEAQAGYACLAAGRRDWLNGLDAWGPPRPANDLMRTLKLRWDPADILNRSEFI